MFNEVRNARLFRAIQERERRVNTCVTMWI